MANTTNEVFQVDEIGKYGPKVSGVFYGLSKRLQEGGATPAAFSVGKKYRAEIWTSDGGKKYINSFELADDSAVVASAPAATSPAAAPAKKSFGGGFRGKSKEDEMSKEEWAKKDRITRSVAIYKSTLESPSLLNVLATKNKAEMADALADIADAVIDRMEKKVASIG